MCIDDKPIRELGRRGKKNPGVGQRDFAIESEDIVINYLFFMYNMYMACIFTVFCCGTG